MTRREKRRSLFDLFFEDSLLSDVEALRREIRQRYPNAEIHIEGGKPLIREVSTTPSEEKEKGKKPSKKQ